MSLVYAAGDAIEVRKPVQVLTAPDQTLLREKIEFQRHANSDAVNLLVRMFGEVLLSGQA